MPKGKTPAYMRPTTVGARELDENESLRLAISIIRPWFSHCHYMTDGSDKVECLVLSADKETFNRHFAIGEEETIQ